MSTPAIHCITRQKISRATRWACLLLTTLATTLLVPAICSAQTEPNAKKPVAILGVNSIDNLLEDVDFVGSLVGQPALAEQIQPMLAGFTQGIDPSRPMGLIVKLGDMGPAGALCLPVTNLQQLVTMLGMFGVTSAPQEDGLLEISAQGQTLYAREVNGWALVSMLPEMLEGLPADPGQLIGTITEQYDVGVRLYVQNIPQTYRDMAVEQLQQGLEAGMQQQANETDEQFSTRQELSQVQIQQLQQSIQELDELTLGIAVDGENQRLLIDTLYTGLPGSELAKRIASNSDPQTNYAGFFQPDAAMMFAFASQASQADIIQFQQMFAALREKVSSSMDTETADSFTDAERELIKSALDDFLDSFLATVEGGQTDGGAVLNLTPNSATLVAGGLVGEPSKIEAGLKKLAELASSKNSEFPGITWNAASHKDVQFHTFQLPLSEEETAAQQLFGKGIDVAFGIGKKSVLMAVGRDGLQAAQDILADSAAQPQKPIAPLELTLALGQILEVAAAFAQGEDQANIRMIAEMLANNAAGRDHIRIVSQPMSNGMRTRIEAEEGVLRAIGMGAMQTQMQQQP